MKTEKRPYDKLFKQEAVRLYESSGKTLAEIEADLWIASGLLSKWRAQVKRDGERAFPARARRL